MPAAKTPAVQGKSFTDIAMRFRDARLKAIGTSSTVEPTSPTDALSGRIRELRDDLTVNKIENMHLRRAEAEIEAEEAETQAKTIEAKIRATEGQSRLQELREQAGQAGLSGNTAITLALLEMLQNQAQNRPEGDPTGAALQAVGNIMKDELAAIRLEIKERTTGEAPKQPLEKLSEDLQTLVALKSIMGEMFPAPVPMANSAQADFETTVKLKELEMNWEIKKAELQMMQERARADMQLREREVEVEVERSRTLAAGIGSLGEAIKPIAAELLQAFQGKPVTPAPMSAVGMTVPQPIQYEVPTNGNGHQYEAAPVNLTPQILNCENCGGKVPLPTDHSITHVNCPECDREYNIDWSQD